MRTRQIIIAAMLVMSAGAMAQQPLSIVSRVASRWVGRRFFMKGSMIIRSLSAGLNKMKRDRAAGWTMLLLIIRCQLMPVNSHSYSCMDMAAQVFAGK